MLVDTEAPFADEEVSAISQVRAGSLLCTVCSCCLFVVMFKFRVCQF